MYKELERAINEEYEMLDQLKGLVGVKFVEQVEARIMAQQKMVDELSEKKDAAIQVRAQYTVPLSEQYFKQIFFNV